MQGIGVKHGNAGVPAELLAQMRNEFLVELKEDEPGVRIHAFDDLAGVATFTWAEFDDNTGLGKINAPRGLPG